MVPASVGFHCPDDVRVGHEGVRPARAAAGGTLVGVAGHVTTALLALNVLVFVVGLAVPDLAVRFGNLGLARVGDGLGGVAAGQWYRLLTAAFLHANLVHLLVNMYALFVVGAQVEAALGRARFLVLYVLSALGGSALSFVAAPPGVLGVGASGAVFGLFGALYVLARRTGGDTRSVLGLLVLNLVITVAVPGIDWRAHVGGLVTGVLLATGFAYAPRGPRRSLVQAAACVGVLLLVVVAVLLRSAALR